MWCIVATAPGSEYKACHFTPPVTRERPPPTHTHRTVAATLAHNHNINPQKSLSNNLSQDIVSAGSGCEFHARSQWQGSCSSQTFCEGDPSSPQLWELGAHSPSPTLLLMGPGEPGPSLSGDLCSRYLAHVVVLEERQEANITACSNALEECDVPVPRIQLHDIVEHIRHGFPSQEQVDKFLLMRERGKACQGDTRSKKKRVEKEGKQGGREPESRGAVTCPTGPQRTLPTLLINRIPRVFIQHPLCTGPCPKVWAGGGGCAWSCWRDTVAPDLGHWGLQWGTRWVAAQHRM